MWPYSWTHVGTPSHLGHMDRVAATMPSQAHAGAAQEAPNIGQWEGQDVPLVRPSSCIVKRGSPELPKKPTYLPTSSSRTSYFSSGFHFRRGLHRVHNTQPGHTWAGLIWAQVPGSAVGRGSRYASATIKKVPTRTGPRCAPSACNPC